MVNYVGVCYVVMKQLILALTLFITALGANAALFLHTAGDQMPATGVARIDLSGRMLEVPKNLIRDRAQMAGGRLERLDLVVSMVDFSPLPPLSAKAQHQAQPDRLSIILTAAKPGSDAPELFQTIYARFLTWETWSNPGGLIMRRFRADTPYEDRELYIGAGGRRVFIALCPISSVSETEPCVATFRQDGLDAEIRFSAANLPDWRRFFPAATAIVSEVSTGQSQAGRP